MCVHVYIYIHICIYIYMCAYVFMCVCACVCVYIYIYTHTYMYTFFHSLLLLITISHFGLSLLSKSTIWMTLASSPLSSSESPVMKCQWKSTGLSICIKFSNNTCIWRWLSHSTSFPSSVTSIREKSEAPGFDSLTWR